MKVEVLCIIYDLKKKINNNNQSFIAHQNKCANPISLHSEETKGEKGIVWIESITQR